MHNADYLTIDEASAISGIPRRTLAEKVRRGTIPRYRDPRDQRRVLVTRKDLDRLLKPVKIVVAPTARP